MIGNPRRMRALSWLAACAVLALAPGVLAAEAKPDLSGVVNLNTASSEQLQVLPGIGESRAVAIVALRKDRGGFKSVDELLDVKGIGSTMLESLRAHLTLSGKTTAKRN